LALDPNRWTLKTQEAFQAAIDNARARSHPEVTPDHLLAALLGQEEGVVLSVLQRAGVAPLTVRNRVEDALDRLPKAYGGAEPQLSRATRDLIETADQERTELHDEYLSTEHLLLALADKVGICVRYAAATGSPARRRRRATRPSSASAATSPMRRAPASSTPSSGVTRRSGASFRSSRGVPRTTRC